MTPEYLEELAQRADPDNLWAMSGMDISKLPDEQRRQMDTAVALRRHAAHVKRLESLRGTTRSLLLTPLSVYGLALREVDTPADLVDTQKGQRK